MFIEAFGDVLKAATLYEADKGGSLGVGVAICFKSVSENEFPRTPGCHAVDVDGGFFLRPREHNRCHVIQIVTINPHIPYIPNWLINWVLTRFAYVSQSRICFT